jgi:hypothetical protein
MNAQEIYDKVATHLRTQGRPSKKAQACFYRGPNDLQCAIGCLVDDETGKRWDEIDGETRISHIIKRHAEGEFLLPEDMEPEEGVEFLDRLQFVHDETETVADVVQLLHDEVLIEKNGAFDREDLEKCLIQAARAYKLEYKLEYKP